MAVRSVSDAELRRLQVLRDVDRGGLPVGVAARLLERSERQVWRLLKAFRAEGAAGLVSKKRGRPSNRKTAAAVRAAALWIVHQNYADFGPTLAAEKLAGEHGFAFSSETLRKWMIADGRWLDRKQRQRRVQAPPGRPGGDHRPVLAMIRDQQLQREPEHRSAKAPRRPHQRDARPFKVGAER